MTRKLSDEEFKSIREPKEWGVLPVRPMGATIRMTKDRRIFNKKYSRSAQSI